MTRVARQDLGARALVTSRLPLLYEGGADPEIDRPAHVRAGSGLTTFSRPSGPALLIAQDDTSFLVEVDVTRGTASPIQLEYAPFGQRQFDEGRGNKKLKLDLEACCSLRRTTGEEVVLCFGSGSSLLAPREHIVVLDRRGPRLVCASRLYQRLRSTSEFAGSELNIEGAVVLGDRIRLFQRGNGAPALPLLPIDATVDLEVYELLSFLDDPERAAIPGLHDIERWELGAIDGVRLTFTDAALVAGEVFFLAAAEASADTYSDGDVAGVALGWMHDEGASWTEILNPDGSRFRHKAEGLTELSGELLAVIDRDDPAIPSELCRLRLERPATGA